MSTLNPKERVFSAGSLVVMVNFDVKTLNESYLVIIGLSNDTILLSLVIQSGSLTPLNDKGSELLKL